MPRTPRFSIAPVLKARTEATWETALEDGAEHVVLPAGHAGLLTRPQAVEAVRRALVERA